MRCDVFLVVSILFMSAQFFGRKYSPSPWWASEFVRTYITPFALGGILFGAGFLMKAFAG
jgi:hypothetical protein